MKTAVAFFVYNRPGLTARAFSAIRAARPPRLLVVADGPGNEEDEERCRQTRAIIDSVDWPCEVMREFANENLGCRRRVSSGLDWVFQQVDQAIIIEDDCLVHEDFFPFCENLLARYADDPRVMHIGGSDQRPAGLQRAESYYFSRYPSIWGWASWRRAWQHYDVNMRDWPQMKAERGHVQLFGSPEEAAHFERIWDSIYSGEIDTWDGQWLFACRRYHGLCIAPNGNLVTNMGFGPEATHTTDRRHPYASLPLVGLPGPLQHPVRVEADAPIDRARAEAEFLNRGSAFRGMMRVLSNKHWYGKWIRSVPLAGSMWKAWRLRSASRSERSMVSGRQKILVLRPDNIGDAVLFSGALRALRKHWPDGTIDLCVKPALRPLYAACPYVDRVFSIYRLMPWCWLRQCISRGTWTLERMMKSAAMRTVWYPRYDIVVYPVSAPVESFLESVRLMPAKEKWGFGGLQINYQILEDGRNAPERVFTRYWVNTAANLWMHELNRTQLFLREMGVDPGNLTPELWLTERDHLQAGRLIPRDGVLACFIGAAHPSRRWPVEKWADLICRQDAADKVVLLGNREDAACGRAVEALVGDRGAQVINLCGATSLTELAACLTRCVACVSNDSAGLHMAVAADIPTVGLLGGYHFGRFYPWGNEARHRLAHVQMNCYHCNAVCRYGDFRCVSGITVDDVLKELNQAVHG